MSASILILLSLSGCNPWKNMPDEESVYFELQLWSADTVVALTDGVYVRLPEAGGLVRVAETGEAVAVDVGGARVQSLQATPDPEQLVAFLRRTSCEDEEVELVSDCLDEEKSIEDVLAVVADGKVAAEISLDTAYNELTFAADGRWAVATLDLDTADLSQSGVVSLNSVSVIDLETSASTPVAVGFDADAVYWTTEADGSATRALVLSKGQVAVIDLTGAVPARVTTFPLSLDADLVVTPRAVSVTADGRYAILAVANSPDLYVMDLVNESINIVELGAVPVEMLALPEIDSTLLTFDSPAQVGILSHDNFDLEVVGLDEPASEVIDVEGFELLWEGGRKDVYRFDPVTRELVEYRLQSDALDVAVSPDGQTAVVLTTASGTGFPGMELLDLTDNESVPYRLEGSGVGLAFTVDDNGGTELLLLQDEVDYLLKLDLNSGRIEEIDLPAPPIAIGALPEGGPFYITHAAPLGLVSFLDGASLTSAAGFAVFGLGDPLAVVEEAK